MDRTVTIPEEVLKPFEQAVAAGKFESVADAPRVITGQWKQDDWTALDDIGWLRAEIASGVGDPRPSLTAGEVEATLKSHVDRHRLRLDART